VHIKIKIEFDLKNQSTVGGTKTWATVWDGKGHSADIALNKDSLTVEELQIEAIRAANEKVKEWEEDELDADGIR